MGYTGLNRQRSTHPSLSNQAAVMAPLHSIAALHPVHPGGTCSAFFQRCNLNADHCCTSIGPSVRTIGESACACWLSTSSSGANKPAMLVSDLKSFMVVNPFGKEHEELSMIVEEAINDESLDSVYQALTGKSPFRAGNTELLVSDVVDDTGEVEDTFHGRRQIEQHRLMRTIGCYIRSLATARNIMRLIFDWMDRAIMSCRSRSRDN